MLLEMWTNKGNDSPIFQENDTLFLYVRTNYACYIRIIDHMADESKVLLVDNMLIGNDKINKVVKLPVMFQCAPPFGIETLQANAQTKVFVPLLTKTENGYDFIKDNMNTILSKTRGFKRLNNEDLQAETRIVLTTMGKGQ